MTHLLDCTMNYLAPRMQSRMLTWCRAHARNTDGRPYSHDAFPHLGAPGGPSDAMDDSSIRKIWMQFASRLGKTFFGQCCVMKKADCNPGPMLFASSVEKTAIEVVERTYGMLSQSPQVAIQLRPRSRRRQSCIDFDACQMAVGWSRSVSTLADKEVEFGHANEIDKWEHLATSKEADPLRLFTDRFKNKPHHKGIFESTPSVKGKSRIESGRLGSTNCQFFVPCPHCEKYQTLKMGTPENPRVRWEHLENGRSDKDIARRTAHYVCEWCGEKIEDHHRTGMMRLGVWCPEGCTVIDSEARKAAVLCANVDFGAKGSDGASATDGYQWLGWKNASWIEGTPLRDGSEAGYQLSSLYALSLTWGDIAAEFVSCKSKPQDLRNFINQWLAETWEAIRRQTTWEQLGGRIIDNDQLRGIVPVWGSLLTCGIDRQSAGGDRFPWVVDAWGPDGQCATIAYGEEGSFEALFSKVISAPWHHADGGQPLTIVFTLMDSGHKPTGVYEFCRSCHAKRFAVWPCKGSQNVLESEYRQSTLGPNTSMPGMVLLMVDTIRSQLWIDNQLDNPDGVYSLHAGTLLEHQDFLEQIVNDAAVEGLDKTNNVRQSYERIDSNIPNDLRDCRRYAYVARLIATHGREVPSRSQPVKQKRSAVINSGTSQREQRW